MNHTPTPWVFDGDAEFIVRACNSHDDLLAALEGIKAALRLTDRGLLWKGKELQERGVLDIGAFFEAWPAAEAAIEKAKK